MKLSRGQAWFLAMTYEASFSRQLTASTAALFYELSKADKFYSWTGLSLVEECMYLVNHRRKT